MTLCVQLVMCKTHNLCDIFYEKFAHKLELLYFFNKFVIIRAKMSKTPDLPKT